MKAQFKYTLLDGLHARGGVFAVMFIMNLVFIVLGSLGLLPLAAQITAVSLSGVAISVMGIVNIVNDVAIIRRMFAAPGAYLFALTPAPRGKTLAANVLAMMIMDTVTTVVAVVGVVWTALILGSGRMGDTVWNIVRSNLDAAGLMQNLFSGLFSIAFATAGYLTTVLFIVAVISARKSVFYQKPAGGILTAVAAVGAVYVSSLLPLLLAPFGTVMRRGMFFTVILNGAGQVFYILLCFAEIAALFVLASKLMERKMNI